MTRNEKFLIIGLATITTAFSFLLPGAMAIPSIVTFDPLNYNGLDSIAQVKVDDPSSNLDSNVAETITVHVWSTSGDPVGVDLDLKEDGLDTGIFKSVALVLTKTDNLFSSGDTIAIILTFTDEEALDFGLDPTIAETLPFDFPVISTTDPIGTVITLTETGINTHRFESKLKLSTDPSSGTNIQVNPGDVVTVVDVFHSELSNFLIKPVTGTYTAALRVFVPDNIHVIYQGIQGDGLVTVGGAGGGSTGGIAISRIVLDVLAGGISGGDFAPPLLTIPKLNLQNLPLVSDILNFIENADPFTPLVPLDDSSIDYPISINGNGYLLTQFANTIQTYKGKTGEPLSFKMNLFDATGVEHIALYTNLRGEKREIQDSDTFIIYNEDKPLEITDPNRYFSNVNFTESEYNGKYIANFNMTFAKPMDTSDVIIRTWDELRNSGDIKVFDAIKIEGEPIVNPDTNSLIVPKSSSIILPYYKLPYYEIPNADFNGNLIYHNSFGGLEEKQVHPESAPIVYPDYIGRDERHGDGFQDSITNEDVRAQKIAQTILVNPFSISEDDSKDARFYYPSNVGKLDRENKNLLNDMLSKENMKAYKISSKKYHNNQVHD